MDRTAIIILYLIQIGMTLLGSAQNYMEILFCKKKQTTIGRKTV